MNFAIVLTHFIASIQIHYLQVLYPRQIKSFRKPLQLLTLYCIFSSLLFESKKDKQKLIPSYFSTIIVYRIVSTTYSGDNF